MKHPGSKQKSVERIPSLTVKRCFSPNRKSIETVKNLLRAHGATA